MPVGMYTSRMAASGVYRITNVAWGDNDWSTLYFTTWNTLGRIRLKIPGIPVPRGNL